MAGLTPNIYADLHTTLTQTPRHVCQAATADDAPVAALVRRGVDQVRGGTGAAAVRVVAAVEPCLRRRACSPPPRRLARFVLGLVLSAYEDGKPQSCELR